MSTARPPLFKRFMLLCMVVLGVQLCFPPSVQASVLPAQQVDMISLGVKDPAGKPGVQVDFDLPPMLLVLLLPTQQEVCAGAGSVAEVIRVPRLLPVAGYHPSAP
ncbi:MAG: hypothetical protein E6Q44_07825 [Flavobacteriales bacterium]|nr:MAG: hypothetical protein E6Q44_07825 [Flavobacteriales bacterium]